MNRAELIQICGVVLFIAGGSLLNIFLSVPAKLGGLLTLYLGAAVLLLRICSLQMCLALAICGVGVTILFLSVPRGSLMQDHHEADRRVYLWFRVLLAFVSGVLAYTAVELLRFWIPVRQTVLFPAVYVMLAGLISLSLDDTMLYRCICLQSVCLAFTITYIFTESSVLVFAFFTVINLLLAFGGSVLSMGSAPEEHEAGEETQ
ncbi:MAG: hypothetical protein IKP86_00530 [Anaerolineaceae bacterium]|nr:hypothetical protein [Anaerolineaceae bacterium]